MLGMNSHSPRNSFTPCLLAGTCLKRRSEQETELETEIESDGGQEKGGERGRERVMEGFGRFQTQHKVRSLRELLGLLLPLLQLTYLSLPPGLTGQLGKFKFKLPQ